MKALNMVSPQFQEIVTFLQAFQEEEGVSKKLKERVNSVILLLQSNSSLVVEKSLAALEELGSLELSSYHRTKVWEAASMLESVLAR